MLKSNMRTLVAFIVGTLVTSCGGDSAGGKASCENSMAAICEKACSCGSDCVVDIVGFDSASECKQFFRFAACEGEEAISEDEVDWEECRSDVNEGQCVDEAFSIPESCGPEEEPPGPPEICVDQSGALTTFVADSFVIPTDALSAEELSFDIDGDGAAENALGDIMGLASSSPEIDFGSRINSSLIQGNSNLLLALKAADFATAQNVGMEVISGDSSLISSDTAPCTPAGCDPEGSSQCICGGHFDGTTTFSFAGNPDSNVVLGEIEAGTFENTKPEAVQLTWEFVSGAPFQLPLKGTKIEAMQISQVGIVQGKIGGGILEADFEAIIVPEIARMLNNNITDHCDTNLDGISQLGEIQTCCGSTETVPAQICLSANQDFQANGYNMAGCDSFCMWNTDADFNVSAQDVKDGPFGAFLAMDIDLNGDGTNDAMSLGIGFTAVAAVFDAPILSSGQEICVPE